ncbi:MAG: type II methionyl aminopeptidase [Candidatus Margulisiibacteriota bacterium]|nr:MAG: type II methionyl aminopeptidase [Candidatus Margulisbacteria bacterium GWD2_39_127]OGI05439.1 MAG: type II methionyl aminopeptidase [Candidatus Margulisbacteria bacterium GWF2_38_17]OGI07823.1 MAG: type II methionyl aminopeptidase [Candidatus Margulisbacteria bacterium GWE2_39_32]PZM80121.1 MAG: type II methionyl aminopeptidase [Candidatus Margulisiibacteriota bacterium]HAR62613.1 type II methionyl aminopeptidase [Candidatus Margulisiibacteriota bacterium]
MENLENWKIAGSIAAKALQYGKGLIKPGVKLLDVAESIEAYIYNEGANPAFPVNLSLNNIAAHYSPMINDSSVFNKKDVVKLDVGVVYQGCLGDTALTVDLSGKHDKLVQSVEAALAAAIAMIKPGVSTNLIGETIEKTITRMGFKPIKNLGGHQMKENNLHCGTFIPNYNDKSKIKLEKGQIIAIEPFAAPRSSYIYEKGDPYIIMLKSPHLLYEYGISDEFIQAIEPFKHLPLSLRWISKRLPLEKWLPAVKELSDKKAFISYEPLCAEKNDVIVQAEHTIIVDDPSIILTLA